MAAGRVVEACGSREPTGPAIVALARHESSVAHVAARQRVGCRAHMLGERQGAVQ
jgi:hypothetical protein